MRKLKSLNKKGVVGLEVGKKVMLLLLTMGIIAFALIVVLNQLDTSNVATAGSVAANQSTNILNNITGGVETFFTNATTWFALLGIVVLILIIVIVIKAVSSTDGSGKKSGGL